MAEEVIRAYYCAQCGVRLLPSDESPTKYRHVIHPFDKNHDAVPKEIRGTVRPNKVG